MTTFDPTDLENLIHSYASADLSKPIDKTAAHTGLLSLDLILGGGLAPGITEVYGPPSTGKTSLAGQIIAHNQRREDFAVAILPSEHLDNGYFTNLGVDLDVLPVLRMAEVSDFLSEFPRALLVIDSLTALVPSAADRNEYLLEAVEELRAMIGPGHCVLLTSHVRVQTSVDPNKTFRSGVRSASKRVTDLFCTRLELSRVEVSPPKYTQVINVVANILGPPSQYVRLHSKMGYGADRFRDLIETAEGVGVLERRGSYYYLGAKRLGAGVKAAKYCLLYDPGVETEIVRRVLERLGS